jgi:hypothetical protein
MGVDSSTLLIKRCVISRLGVHCSTFKGRFFHILGRRVYFSTYGSRLFYDHAKGFIILCKGVDYVSISARKIYGWERIFALGYKKTKNIDGFVEE